MFYVGPDVQFTAQVIHYLPSEPKELNGSIKTVKGIKTRRGFMVEGAIEEYAHGGVREFGFNEGDPIGAYELDLMINGRRSKTIKYQVVAEKVSHDNHA